MVGKTRGLTLDRRTAIGIIGVIPFAQIAACKRAGPGKEVPFVAEPTTNRPLTLSDKDRLVELVKLDPSIKLDLRYATANNFTGRVLYDQARAFMVGEAADALLRAHARAREDGFGFTIFDAYRPWRVTKKLWDATPPGPKKNYVANPKKGSRHNRGCAVDMSMHDMKTGQLVEMPSGFDDFSMKAERDYSDDTPAAAANAKRLESYMYGEGFIGMSNEWWHFDYKNWEQHPVMDIPFDKVT
jgi:zinc D-Ala-D-Ala dipeptidase